MTANRRFLLALNSLLVLAASGALIALLWAERSLDLSLESLTATADFDAGDTAKLIATAALGAVALIALYSLYLSMTPAHSRRDSALRLRQGDGGTVEVRGSALEALLTSELERIPEVTRAEPRVRVHKGAVDSDIGVAIEPGASIAHVTTNVVNVTRQALQEQVGVNNVRRPAVRVRYDENAVKRTREERTVGLVPERMAPQHVDRGERPVYPAEPVGLRNRDRAPDVHD
ncbi:MAG TPA: alkaline shock response membrane anchor protein AmaP [Tepidiformaceae bacterium]|nr:alkaline shock response membrane anchor protein AmaP [Tepidiformaceae bacterium]